MKMLPTLTTDGFITHPPHMMVKLYEYFISSDYSQSVTFFGSIVSLRYLVKEYEDDLDVLKTEVRDALNKLYSNYWDNVEILLDIVPDDNDEVVYSIVVDIEVVVDDNTYTLNKSINVTNNTFLNSNINIEYLESGVI